MSPGTRRSTLDQTALLACRLANGSDQAWRICDGGQRRFSEWDEDGNIHQLPGLDDTPEINALGINKRGVIVGSEMTAEFVATEARLWLDGEVHDLQDQVPLPPEYRLRSAVDINSAFVAAIWARAPGGRAGKGASPCVEISTPP